MVSNLVSAIWEGAVLAFCVALCLRFLPDISATARWVVWTNVFLLLLLLHFLRSLDAQLQSGTGFQASPFHLDPLWSVVIAGVWLMLSLWRGGQLISSAIHLRGLAARATRIQPDASILTLLQSGWFGRSAQLCTSTEVERPCVVGFLHPRILLPLSLFRQLSAIDLEQVVLHEMEHLHRADDWTNLLQKVGVVFFPLNPVLYWVERRLCVEREFACDDRVLRSSCGRKNYALCLTRLAEFTIISRSLSLALGAWERRSELARRVHRILRRRNESMRRGPAIVLTGSLVMGVLAGAIALAHSPQIVSFAPHAQSTTQQRSLTASALRPESISNSGGYPTLVKAVMPHRTSPQASLLNYRRGASQKLNVQRRLFVSSPPEFIVLTEWEINAPPPRLIFAVAEDHRSSYAAVAVANGWLIVQI
ncbi:MAG: M56 family metallopeptidase [Acidimicrobiales bacterium]|jgi:beta-lactamase regulating signal transducer with metallopeptidase domain